MLKVISVGLLAGSVSAFAASEEVDSKKVKGLNDISEAMSLYEEEDSRGRKLFPIYAVSKCSRFCSAQASAVQPTGTRQATKGPVKALEMLALNDDLNTVVQSGSMCQRRQAMARAFGLAAGLSLGMVNAPAFAAETKTVKMGSDSGQLVFVPDEIKICKGDSVSWVNNKGGPHNVVFEEDNIPKGVNVDDISMDEQLGDEGDTYVKKFDVPGSYAYYCEPHVGGGMKATLVVE